MALINCPECGREISSKSKMCLYCGCPCDEWEDCIQETEEHQSSNTSECVEIIEDENIGLVEYIGSKYSKEDRIYFIKELRSYTELNLQQATEVVDRYLYDGTDILGIRKNEVTKKETLPYSAPKLKHNENTKETMYCKWCGQEINKSCKFCPICGEVLSEEISLQIQQTVEPQVVQKQFSGIYRYSVWSGKQEVYCPRCDSENCSYYQEQNLIPGKTKTKVKARYSVNLNPLKPFTILNKKENAKEKIVRKERIVTRSKIMCNDCGYIFD